MRTAFPALLVSAALALALADAAHAGWSEFADEQEVLAIVYGEDGQAREVKIWLVVLDDRGFVRTRNTRWRADFERDPKAALRIRGKDHPVRAIPVKDPALYERVNAAYTAKYGRTPHVFLAVMRPFLGPWHVYRVEER